MFEMNLWIQYPHGTLMVLILHLRLFNIPCFKSIDSQFHKAVKVLIFVSMVGNFQIEAVFQLKFLNLF